MAALGVSVITMLVATLRIIFLRYCVSDGVVNPTYSCLLDIIAGLMAICVGFTIPFISWARTRRNNNQTRGDESRENIIRDAPITLGSTEGHSMYGNIN
jgi:hypothetical protein